MFVVSVIASGASDSEERRRPRAVVRQLAASSLLLSRLASRRRACRPARRIGAGRRPRRAASASASSVDARSERVERVGRPASASWSEQFDGEHLSAPDARSRASRSSGSALLLRCTMILDRRRTPSASPMSAEAQCLRVLDQALRSTARAHGGKIVTCGRGRDTVLRRRFRIAVLRLRAPPRALRDALELLARHVAEHLVVDPRDERPRARELARALEPLLGDASLSATGVRPKSVYQSTSAISVEQHRDDHRDGQIDRGRDARRRSRERRRPRPCCRRACCGSAPPRRCRRG